MYYLKKFSVLLIKYKYLSQKRLLKAHPALSVSLCLSDYKCAPVTQAVTLLPSKTVDFFHCQ